MKVEIRADNTVELSGYVNAVERRSQPLPVPGQIGKYYTETVAPGTFQRAINRGSVIALKLNHGRIIDSTKGSLELREDNIGLHAHAVVSDPETVQAAKEKRLTGWSFGFRCCRDHWDEKHEQRTLEDIDLHEVSILTVRPAYAATSVEIRSAADDEVELINAVPEYYYYRQRQIEILKLKGE